MSKKRVYYKYYKIDRQALRKAIELYKQYNELSCDDYKQEKDTNYRRSIR